MFMLFIILKLFYFFFNITSTTEIYTLSLHDALPICRGGVSGALSRPRLHGADELHRTGAGRPLRDLRSEEHTSELQSLRHLVCRLLLEKKNKKIKNTNSYLNMID